MRMELNFGAFRKRLLDEVSNIPSNKTASMPIEKFVLESRLFYLDSSSSFL
jgi:hypothetical protein